MKFYFAPLEGVTGHIYRRAHHKYFNEVDKYFSPFIAANQHVSFKTREINDILPENNEGMVLVPQILGNNATDFIGAAEKIKTFGYDEINLNLGCPSGTVVAKYKGSGFLAKPEELDHFLDEVYSKLTIKLSIKTRIGKDTPEEFARIMEIYNKYPVEELIIHPRIQKDMYKNKPNLTVFREALENCKHPICYNGDIFTSEDYRQFQEAFPTVERMMLGRGVIANPGLIEEVKHQKPMNKEIFKAFHDEVYGLYRGELSGDRNVLFKMKELWAFMSQMFTNYEKYAKKIRKAERLPVYEEAVSSIFREQELIPGAGFLRTPKNK